MVGWGAGGTGGGGYISPGRKDDDFGSDGWLRRWGSVVGFLIHAEGEEDSIYYTKRWIWSVRERRSRIKDHWGGPVGWLEHQQRCH